MRRSEASWLKSAAKGDFSPDLNQPHHTHVPQNTEYHTISQYGE